MTDRIKRGRKRCASAVAMALLSVAGVGYSSIVQQQAVPAGLPTVDAVAAASSQKLLVLQSGIFDPTTSRLNDASFKFAPVLDNHYFVVQFDGKMPSTLDIEKAGFRVAGYVPNNAYLIDASANDRGAISRLRNVRFVGAWEPAFKVSDSARVFAQTRADMVVEINVWRLIPRLLRRVPCCQLEPDA